MKFDANPASARKRIDVNAEISVIDGHTFIRRLAVFRAGKLDLTMDHAIKN